MLDCKPISLSLFSVKLDGAKLNKALIDQIPLQRLHELVDEECTGNNSNENEIKVGDLEKHWDNEYFDTLKIDFDIIKPICRFNSIVLIDSLTRRYKAQRYDKETIDRLIDRYTEFEECVLLEYMGKLFFDFFSAGKYTVPKLFETNTTKLENLDKTLKQIHQYQTQYESDYNIDTFFDKKSSSEIKTLKNANIDYFMPYDWEVLRRNKDQEYATLNEDLLSTLMEKMGDEESRVAVICTTIKEQLEEFQRAMSELNQRISKAPMAMFGI